MKGFTLTELIIVIAIIMIITTVSFVGLFNYRNRQNVSLTVDEVMAVVRDTQNRSFTQKDGQQWGIRFKNASDDQYEVFKGAVYSSTTLDRVYNLRREVKFGEPAEGFVFDVIFNPITGKPNFSKIISLFGGASQKTVGDIIINISGLITARLEDGLVGYWHFDEGTSSIVYDSSGNNNNGNLINGPNWQSESNCKVGKCLSFDGVNDYVSILDSTYLRLTGDASWLAWVKTSLPNGKRNTVISKTYNNEFDIVIEPDGTISFYHGNGVWEEFQEPAGAKVTASQWTHFAIVRTISNKTVKWYVNGEYVGFDDFNTVPTASTQNIQVGSRLGTSDFFNGIIDEVRIYNRALSDSEIKAIYDATK